MQNPLISIGLPTYNRSKTLERTIQNLLSQTYTNLEIIISDNCSDNPEVEKIINKYLADPRFRYYRQSVNLGPILNMNFILEKVTGEYFMRTSDDDWFDNNYIESCLTFLLQNPEYSSAYGAAKIYDTSENFVENDSEIDMIQSSSEHRVLLYLSAVYKNACFYGLMHKKFLPYLIAEHKFAFDWVVVARIAFLGKFKMLSSVYSYITLGGASQSVHDIVRVCRLPYRTNFFPFLTASINIFVDVLFDSKAYAKLNFINRGVLALKCFVIVYRRTGAKKEIIPGIKGFLKYKFSNNKATINSW